MDGNTAQGFAGDSDSGIGDSVAPSLSSASSSSHDHGMEYHNDSRSSTSGVSSHHSNSTLTSGTGHQNGYTNLHTHHNNAGHSDSGIGGSIGTGRHDDARSSTSGVFSDASNSTFTGRGQDAGSVPLPDLPGISMIDVFLNDGTIEHKISIDQDRTVRELRTCVQEKTSVRPNEQHLSVDVIEGPNRVRTRVLEARDDTSSLRDCSIVHRSRINMRVANRGTPGTWENTSGRANGHPRTAEQARNTFQVFVQTLNGKTITIDTCSEDTRIGVLKKKIQAKTGDAPQQQALSHAGKPLDQDSATLQQYKIGQHSTIVMNARLRGGCTSERTCE
ncbi:uncharacterized protein [Diadema antillarum]|uniref:uncharacterized protein n=1 Tax=Diadema antillarum TaxID=105358 RepID=UPI003A848C55